MSGRDERLRRLLRDADPAGEAPELGADDVARLRRTVLSAVGRESRSWPARPSFALACAAAMAAAVLGFALWRFGLTSKSTPGEDRSAAALPAQTPSGHRTARPSTPREASPTASAGSTSPSIAMHGSQLASARRHAATEATRTRHRSSERAIDSLPAGPVAESTPAETVASAEPASEPQQPYQLQLTAPGGTRIVWLLTSSSGR